MSNTDQMILIAGPCAIEGEEMAFKIADHLHQITQKYPVQWIFKGSYRKANRSKSDSFTGIGDGKALQILKNVGAKYQVPVLTDIHESHEAAMAAEYVDVLQIPAFLCRQTDLLHAAAATGKIVNIKKGQFMSAESMKFAAEKVREVDGGRAWLTERGTTFGYQDLVVDFRGIPLMKSFSEKVILDCTHSLQQPNQSVGVTGGKPALISTIAKAGAAVGADGFFIETHYNPSEAQSDAANMLPLDQLEGILVQLLAIRKALAI